MRKLIHDTPEFEGMSNALKRAKQMTDIYWNPVRALPAGYGHWNPSDELCYSYFFFPKYQPQKGLIYSSVRDTQKYIGINVSFETYISALANPESVLYTRPIQGKSPGMFCYYGVVCSILVCYAFNISVQIPCNRWLMQPGVEEVDITDFNNIKLCDFVLDPDLHIAMITDIARDEEGNIVELTTSESTQPKCLVTKFTAKQFKEYWLIHNNYKVYRYAKLDQVPYTPTPYVHIEGDPDLAVPEVNKDIAVNFGNKANYEMFETVRLTLLNDNWNQIRVVGPNGYVFENEGKKLSFVPEEAGCYSAFAVCKEKTSAPVEFCVTRLTAKPEKEEYSHEESVLIKYCNELKDDEIVGYMINDDRHYMHGREEFASKKAPEGMIDIGKYAKGRYYAMIFGRNGYGMYKSTCAWFNVD